MHYTFSWFSALNNMNDCVTQEQNDENMLLDAEFGFDAYTLGSCI